MNSANHLFWITSRAAGTLALLLTSASVIVGMLVSSRRQGSNKPDLRAIHEAMSLTALAMIALHGISLLGDSFLRPGIEGIAIPFAGSYRPLWTGVGIVAGYGLAILGLTYYVRDRIGSARWRRLHRLTALFWLGGIVHALGAGTDAAEVWFLALNAAVATPAALLVFMRWASRAALPRSASERPRAAAGDA